MRKIGFLVLSGVLAIAAFGYALAPFTLTTRGEDPDSLQAAERTECSAPIRQALDSAEFSVETTGHELVVHNVVPVCKNAGRSRLLTSVALLIAAVLAALLAFSVRRNADPSSESSPAVESSSPA